MHMANRDTTPTIGFRSFQLLRSQTLGIGSYGSICKVLCDDSLLCAAKIIHPTLFDPNAHQQIEPEREHRLPFSRFMKECEVMSAIKHPNIVQYLGTCQDPQTGLPVLLMELLDDSLTHFLENLQNEVTYRIQVNVCHDITLAISYLHSNGITHRDLSSNNVLLCGNLKAKVTDFGMARLGDINPQAPHVSFTVCPGTDAYMPPEAVKDKPVYTAKIDCFAIGVLIIQILTRCFPEPGDRLKIVHTTDPQFPSGTVDVRVPEIERRQNHISQVDPNHPLLPIALHCLSDSPNERPSAQELCHRVAALKDTPQFREGVRRTQETSTETTSTDSDEAIKKLQQQVQDKDDIIQQKDDIIRERDGIIQEKNDMIRENDKLMRKKEESVVASQQKCQELMKVIRDKEQLIEDSESHLKKVTELLQSNEQVTAQFQTRIQELEQVLLKTKLPTQEGEQSSQPRPKHPHSDTSRRVDNFMLRWREVNKAPQGMSRVPNATVDGDTVYFRADTRIIYSYKTTDETWNRLPKCPAEACSIIVINSLLTTIGGRVGVLKYSMTNQLFSLTGEGKNMKWTEVFQPMPTKRSSSVAVSSGHYLIVAGGKDQLGYALTTVEVMDLTSQVWTTGADLRKPLYNGSITICHDRIYILGGFNKGGPTKLVYMCTLSNLFKSSIIWDEVAELPVAGSTCVTFHGRLLAIGGGDSKPGDVTTSTQDVYMYHPTSNTWDVISKMNVSRRYCFAAVLSNNDIMVVGGYNINSVFSGTSSVERATVF